MALIVCARNGRESPCGDARGGCLVALRQTLAIFFERRMPHGRFAIRNLRSAKGFRAGRGGGARLGKLGTTLPC